SRRFTVRFLPCFRQTRIAHLSYCRRLLHCGISIRPMSGWHRATRVSGNYGISARGKLGSFRFYVRRLYCRPPFFDLGFLIRGERLWCLLLGRRQFLTHVDVALLDGRVGKRCTHRAVELRDDVGGRTLGQPEAVPETHDQTGYAHFLKGWHLRRREPA